MNPTYRRMQHGHPNRRDDVYSVQVDGRPIGKVWGHVADIESTRWATKADGHVLAHRYIGRTRDAAVRRLLVGEGLRP